MLKRFLALMLLTLAGAAGAVHAAPAKPLPLFHLDPSEYIPVREVRPGMTGYGLTVFKGVTISRFGVRVVGVMPQGDMGRPLVLVRLSGGPITERKANLIQGMSGSPIYINGRLLGAFALGESTGREPIGMVRPIEDMIDAFDPRLPSKPQFASAFPEANTSAIAASAFPAGGAYAMSASAPLGPIPGLESLTAPVSPTSEVAGFQPLPLPLMASGFGGRSLQTLNAWLKPLGIQAMAGPGGGGGTDIPSYFPKNVPLQPGSSLAVSLAQGDVDVTAIGTVTYRKGNRILAFGHPFLQLGPAEYPASTAYIHDVFSSIVISHKYGSPIRTVGTIQQDGPFSVGGLLHRLPHMVPLTVSVSDSTTGRSQDFHIRLVNHPMLLPGLILSAAQEVIDRIRPFPGDSMAKVDFTVYPEGYDPITKANIAFNGSSISAAALMDVRDALVILSMNPFEPVPIKKVNIRVRLSGGHNTAVVQRAWIEKTKVEPGDTVTVQAVVKPYKKPAETRTAQLKIPENAPVGAAQVVVFGGQTGFGKITASDAPPSGTSVSTTSLATNVRQMINQFEEREQNDELGVRVLLPGSAVSVDGQKMSSLPETLASVMKSTKASNTRLERDEVRFAEHVPYILAGAQVLSLTVEKKNAVAKADTPAAPAAVSVDSADTTDDATSADATDSADNVPDDGSDDATAMAARHALDVLRGHGAALATDLAAAAEKPAPRKVTVTVAPTPGDDKTGAEGKTEAKTNATADTTAKADTGTEGKGPGRVASLWKQLGKTAFEAGRLTDTSVTSDGDVVVTPALKSVSDTMRPYIWSVLPLPDGTVIAGTGNRGEVLRIGKDGKAVLLAKTGDLEVHALARDAAGNIYAGTGPHGRIIKITPSGQTSTLYETGQRYVLSLAMDASGNLYAGTGPDGRIDVVSPDGKGREFLRLPEAHVMTLAFTRDGDLLAGTSPDGLVFRIRPDATTSVVFDASETTVTGVGTDKAGTLYVATAPKGKVYRVHADGRGEVLLDKSDDSLMSLVVRDDGTVYAAGGKTVYRIAPDKTVTTLDNEDQNQIVSLAQGPDGTLWAGSANTGVVYQSVHDATGALLSSVHDASLRARWGRLDSLATVPSGAKVTIQTRSGNVAQPDSTWSDWSAPIAGGSAAEVTSPPARFLQYRATLTAAPDGESPVVHWVAVRYLTDNRPPTVTFTDPKDGDRWSGKKTIKWTGSDPDSDLLTYTLYASNDNGATWTAINTLTGSTAKAETPKSTETTKSADQKAADAAEKAKQDAKNAETAQKVEQELSKYNDLSPEMRSAILQTARTALTANGKEENGKKETPENLSKSTYSWDTATEKDGIYRLKVVATDKASNPEGALTAEAVSGPIVISNAKPTVTVASGTQVATDGTVTVQGEADAPLLAVVRVSYRVDDGDWKAAIARDGIFDSRHEGWRLVTDALESGEHTIEVKAADEVDNAATATTKVTVP